MIGRDLFNIEISPLTSRCSTEDHIYFPKTWRNLIRQELIHNEIE